MAKKPIDTLNELITWYEKYKPEAGKRIPVGIGPLELAKMLGIDPVIINKQPCTEYTYRDRIIVAVGRA